MTYYHPQKTLHFGLFTGQLVRNVRCNYHSSIQLSQDSAASYNRHIKTSVVSLIIIVLNSQWKWWQLASLRKTNQYNKITNTSLSAIKLAKQITMWEPDPSVYTGSCFRL